MIQFRTCYTLPSGTRVTRVTTVAHHWSPPSRGLQVLPHSSNLLIQFIRPLYPSLTKKQPLLLLLVWSPSGLS